MLKWFSEKLAPTCPICRHDYGDVEANLGTGNNNVTQQQFPEEPELMNEELVGILMSMFERQPTRSQLNWLRSMRRERMRTRAPARNSSLLTAWENALQLTENGAYSMQIQSNTQQQRSSLQNSVSPPTLANPRQGESATAERFTKKERAGQRRECAAPPTSPAFEETVREKGESSNAHPNMDRV